MDFPIARRSKQNPPSDPLGAGPRIFLTLAGGDEPAVDQRTLPRKAFVIFAMALYLVVMPLYWATAAEGSTGDAPQAVLAKDSDEDDDEPEENDGPDTTGDNDTGTGRETAAANTDQPGLETGQATGGETDGADGTGGTETNQTTGRETQAANTDAAGVNTFGASTRGETDPGDNTGKTEVR